VEFRGFPPAEVEAIQKQLGDQVVARYHKALIHWGVAFNVERVSDFSLEEDRRGGRASAGRECHLV
jgi:hypothetical protein